jgi:hypothetical protein
LILSFFKDNESLLNPFDQWKILAVRQHFIHRVDPESEIKPSRMFYLEGAGKSDQLL